MCLRLAAPSLPDPLSHPALIGGVSVVISFLFLGFRCCVFVGVRHAAGDFLSLFIHLVFELFVVCLFSLCSLLQPFMGMFASSYSKFVSLLPHFCVPVVVL